MRTTQTWTVSLPPNLLREAERTAKEEDRTWHPSQQTVLEKGGRLRMALTVAATPEVVGWLLGFGGGVMILRPQELKDAVRCAAERIVQKNKRQPSMF